MKMASHALVFHRLSDTRTVNNSNERRDSWWKKNPLVLTRVEQGGLGERGMGGGDARVTDDIAQEKWN